MGRENDGAAYPVNPPTGEEMDAIARTGGADQRAEPADTDLAAQARGEGAEGVEEMDTGVNMFTTEGDDAVPPDADDLQGAS